LDPAEGTGFPDFAELGVPANPLQRSVSIWMGSEPPRAVIFEAVGGRASSPTSSTRRRLAAGSWSLA